MSKRFCAGKIFPQRCRPRATTVCDYETRQTKRAWQELPHTTAWRRFEKRALAAGPSRTGQFACASPSGREWERRLVLCLQFSATQSGPFSRGEKVRMRVFQQFLRFPAEAQLPARCAASHLRRNIRFRFGPVFRRDAKLRGCPNIPATAIANAPPR
jgi:hypothetical protein